MNQQVTKKRVNYSFFHFNSAKYFCSQLHAIENSRNAEDVDLKIQHSAYASGAILASVAFLESALNELIPDNPTTNKYPDDALDYKDCLLLSEVWPEIERLDLLKKFQVTLTILRRQKFENERQPYQNAKLLIKLRNELVHYKPEWNTELKKHSQLEKNLRGKFPANTLKVNEHEVFFPHKCMGYGCAKWAVDTAYSFIAEFYKRLKIEFMLEYIVPHGMPQETDYRGLI